MPIEIPQLDDMDFEKIVNEVVARIPVHNPEWNDFNNSDPGITLVQLFAFMMENLLYRSNRIPENNRLKFLTLLGLPLRPASPGYGLVNFINEKGPVSAIPFDKGNELYAGKVPFRTRTDANILPVTAAVFYKQPYADSQNDSAVTRAKRVYTTLLNSGGTNGQFYRSTQLEAPAVGKPLPEVDLKPRAEGGSTIDQSLWVALLAAKTELVDAARRAIAEQTLSIGIFPSLWTEARVLEAETLEASQPLDEMRLGLLFEIASPRKTDSQATPRYTRLKIEYAENVLEMPGLVQVVLPPYDALERWNFEPSEEGTGEFPPLVEDRKLAERIVTWIRVSPLSRANTGAGTNRQSALSLSCLGINAARVIQALKVENERLGVATGTPNQAFKVANTPVIVERLQTLTGALPPEQTFTLELIDTQDVITRWQRIDDLNAAGPDDTVYMIDPESGIVRCGDGLRGKRFPFGSVLRATYEYGGGLQGKIAIGALNKAPALPGAVKVANPVATWGASQAETVAEGEARISDFLRNRDRLVTAADYRDITFQTPGVDIGRVEVLPLFSPQTNASYPTPGVVTVMVVPQHPLEQQETPWADRLFLNAVRTWLDPRRLITARVYVRGPEWIGLYVAINIRLMPGHISAVVRRDVRDAVRAYLSPLSGGIPQEGAEYGSGYLLGSELRHGDLSAVVARVTGVRFVEEVAFGYSSLAPDGTRGPLATVPLNPPTNRLQFNGIQLPWLVNIDVSERQLADLDTLHGSAPSAGTVALPVLPKNC